MIATWFLVEILVFIIGFAVFGISEDEVFIMVIPALGLAIASAFFILKKVKALDNYKDLTLDEFSTKDDNLDHFR